MSRVLSADVKRIFDTEIEDLSTFIQVATLQVDRVASRGLLSAAELKELERWLAAHFCCVFVRQPYKMQVGDVSHSYVRPLEGKGFSSTRYGLQALELDRTGVLAGLKPAKTYNLGRF